VEDVCRDELSSPYQNPHLYNTKLFLAISLANSIELEKEQSVMSPRRC
jgi:hypothetical protein